MPLSNTQPLGKEYWPLGGGAVVGVGVGLGVGVGVGVICGVAVGVDVGAGVGVGAGCGLMLPKTKLKVGIKDPNKINPQVTIRRTITRECPLWGLALLCGLHTLLRLRRFGAIIVSTEKRKYFNQLEQLMMNAPITNANGNAKTAKKIAKPVTDGQACRIK